MLSLRANPNSKSFFFLTPLILSDARLRNQILSHTRLHNQILSDARLHNQILSDTRLHNQILRGCRFCNIRHCVTARLLNQLLCFTEFYTVELEDS